MKQLTPTEVVEKLVALDSINQNRGTKIRRGQFLMNELHRYNPSFYDAITGTKADCFYEDSKIGAFYRALLVMGETNTEQL